MHFNIILISQWQTSRYTRAGPLSFVVQKLICLGFQKAQPKWHLTHGAAVYSAELVLSRTWWTSSKATTTDTLGCYAESLSDLISFVTLPCCFGRLRIRPSFRKLDTKVSRECHYSISVRYTHLLPPDWTHIMYCTQIGTEKYNAWYTVQKIQEC